MKQLVCSFAGQGKLLLGSCGFYFHRNADVFTEFTYDNGIFFFFNCCCCSKFDTLRNLRKVPLGAGQIS